MERIIDHNEDDLIDLGAASVETQGDPGDYSETIGRLDKPVGLSND